MPEPPSPAQSRPDSLVAATAVVLLAGYTAAVAAMTIERSVAEIAGAENLQHLWPFWISAGLLWLILGLLILQIGSNRPNRPDRSRAAEPAEPGRASYAAVAVVILLVAIGARLVVLMAHDPALSDDIYRYAFDGRNAAEGFNPHLVLPADRVDSPDERWPGERALAERINHPDLRTIYLPTSQWVFRAIAQWTPLDWRDPEAVARGYRAWFISFELLAMMLLTFALYRDGRSAWWLAAYAWHPLPLVEVAGSGHVDAIGLPLLLGALLLLKRPADLQASTPGSRMQRIGQVVDPRRCGSVALLALAALVKPMAALVAPFALRGAGWLQRLTGIGFAVIVVLVVAGPLLLASGGRPLAAWWETAGTFTETWAHFGGTYEMLLAAIDRLLPGRDPADVSMIARLIGLVVVVAVGLVLFFRRVRMWRAAMWLLLVMVIVSPAAHPWYLLWVLILFPLAPTVTAWVLSFTLLLGYAAYAAAPDWHVPGWLLVAAWAPVYAAILVDLANATFRSRKDDPARAVAARSNGDRTPVSQSGPEDTLSESTSAEKARKTEGDAA